MKQIERHFRKILAQPDGSRHFKVDLHIHTPSSKDARGAKVNYGYSQNDAKSDRKAGYPRAREIANQILDKLALEGIQVAAFTDHNSPGYIDNDDFSTPSWYQLISETYEVRRDADPDHPPPVIVTGGRDHH